MVHGFDVVPVGVEYEGAVVAGMVGPLAGDAMVASAGGERRAMEGVDGRPVRRLEGEMDVRPGPSALSTQSSSAWK